MLSIPSIFFGSVLLVLRQSCYHPCVNEVTLQGICKVGHILITTNTTQYMMTSSNGNIFRVTGPLCGEFTGPGEFPTQSPVTRSFDVSFDLRLYKRLSKQPWGWWFETLSWSLWRHTDENHVCYSWDVFVCPLTAGITQTVFFLSDLFDILFIYSSYWLVVYAFAFHRQSLSEWFYPFARFDSLSLVQAYGCPDHTIAICSTDAVPVNQP